VPSRLPTARLNELVRTENVLQPLNPADMSFVNSVRARVVPRSVLGGHCVRPAAVRARIATAGVAATGAWPRLYSSSGVADTQVVVSIFGQNRTGLVAAVTRIIYEQGGNVEESRMDRLGEHCSILSMVTLPATGETEATEALRSSLLEGLSDGGAPMTVSAAASTRWRRPAVRELATVSVMGNESRGIVKEVTAVFAKEGVDIVTAESEVLSAPFSGADMFKLVMVVNVPNEGRAKLVTQLAEIEESFHSLDIQFDVMA
jgi:glycine cleavage system regulatory protein